MWPFSRGKAKLVEKELAALDMLEQVLQDVRAHLEGIGAQAAPIESKLNRINILTKGNERMESPDAARFVVALRELQKQKMAALSPILGMCKTFVKEYGK